MPDGSRIPEDADEDEDYSIPGTTLRLMWDHDAGPLWAGGLLPDEPELIERALGVSPELVDELLEWWRELIAFHAGPIRPRSERRRLDRRGHQLAKTLQTEMGGRLAVSYRT